MRAPLHDFGGSFDTDSPITSGTEVSGAPETRQPKPDRRYL
jgi:hypothetical protein